MTQRRKSIAELASRASVRRLRKAAFTLIELSIVLVIIGLLVGGVLAGRALISSAALNAQISQINQYNTAVGTFRTKYNCLPGDCANASDFGFTSTGPITNGDGNGQIGIGWYYWIAVGAGAADYPAYEQILFWSQMNQAGLIAEETPLVANNVTAYGVPGKLDSTVVMAGVPEPTANNGFFYYDGPINYFWLSGLSSATTAHITDGLTPAQASAIDSKLDDGIPYSGRVVATTAQSVPNMYNKCAPRGAGFCGVQPVAPNICIASPTAYANPVANFNANCTLQFQMSGT